ncbi:hypothetical protein [Leucobacter tardus]|uniref:Uncharacterized protein n=1 Tax=Leucobacter tardus TaxID=501483 RepID=A0A939TVF5_9MICO|nr:hypothetical protein [Leucobacter tardus]MBO2990750.1 hypothetical protein [Leucobacter tardus]
MRSIPSSPAHPPTFTPVRWVLTHPGTNGYISTWGEMLSGTTPTRAAR